MSAARVYRYGPWGEPDDGWASGQSRFRYTGQIALSEVKLYHYKARVYDPAFGRFLQTDPIGYRDDLDLYAYVGGDPVGRNDPTGTQSVANDLDRVLPTIAGKLVQPITGPISSDQASRVEAKVGFSEKGPGEVITAVWDAGGAMVAEGSRVQSEQDNAATPTVGSGDAVDAGRHVQWVAGMTKEMGGERAKAFSDAHERGSPTPRGDRLMDLINNNARVFRQAFPDFRPDQIRDALQGLGFLQEFKVEIE